jgi:hypothetical protein
MLTTVRLRCGLLFVLALLAHGPPAAAAQPRLALSRAAAEPGERVLSRGLGFPRTARVRLVLAGRTVRRARTGRRGGFRLGFRVPARTQGRYRFTALSGGRVVRLRFRIRARAVVSAPGTTPVAEPSPSPPGQPVASTTAPTLVAAGDIACRPELSETPTQCRQARTAQLVLGLAPDAVATLGDAQYQGGELENYQAVYHPTWGAFKSITHPATGNHEYEGVPDRRSAPGHFGYFGSAAGEPDKGYYRWSLGGWTLLVLNSGAIDYTRSGGGGAAEPDDCWPVSCAAGSAQVAWLRAQLESLPDDACTIAYWHHPRWSSGWSGVNRDYPEVGPIFEALHDHGVELALTGHAHSYERFARLDPSGALDPATGVRQLVVGTGGRSLFADPGPPRPGSELLRMDSFGVLELTLAAGGYAFRFVREDGVVLDAGAEGCHARPQG